MNFEMYIKFYDNPSKKQNMWMEVENCEGKRYEINNMEDAKNAFEGYINNVIKRLDSN